MAESSFERFFCRDETRFPGIRRHRKEQTMAIAIEAETARWAGLQIDLNTKFRNGGLTMDHLEWFLCLTRVGRDELIAGTNFDPQLKQQRKPLYVVMVDRNAKPAGLFDYELVHPQLYATGPGEYNLKTDVEPWWHTSQNTFWGVVGHEIYNALLVSKELEKHLGYADLLAIQNKGVGFFRALKRGGETATIFAWKSIVRNKNGVFLVPFLRQSLNDVVMDWHPLSGKWQTKDIGLKFVK